MKHIIKNPEPEQFTAWKSANQSAIEQRLEEGASGDVIFNLLLGKPHPESSAVKSTSFYKNDLKIRLLEEQGYICCYCNRSLENNHHTIIEHYYPKGRAEHRHNVFDYDNLLVCCDGGEREVVKPRKTHCGLKKGDVVPEAWFVSPFNPNCETAFTFNEQGKISAQDENARRTIALLGLDAPSLEKLREAAINTYIFDILEDHLDTESEIKRLLEKQNGRFEPFCIAIIDVLKNYP
jgi:uncharacterized protein (TIGR02646 family)